MREDDEFVILPMGQRADIGHDHDLGIGIPIFRHGFHAKNPPRIIGHHLAKFHRSFRQFGALVLQLDFNRSQFLAPLMNEAMVAAPVVQVIERHRHIRRKQTVQIQRHPIGIARLHREFHVWIAREIELLIILKINPRGNALGRINGDMNRLVKFGPSVIGKSRPDRDHILPVGHPVTIYFIAARPRLLHPNLADVRFDHEMFEQFIAFQIARTEVQNQGRTTISILTKPAVVHGQAVVGDEGIGVIDPHAGPAHAFEFFVNLDANLDFVRIGSLKGSGHPVA